VDSDEVRLGLVAGDELHLLVLLGLDRLVFGLVPWDLELLWRDLLGVGESLLDVSRELKHLNRVETFFLAVVSN
jgi:hypothetical protein